MKELKVFEDKVREVIEKHPEVKDIMKDLFDGQLGFTYSVGDRFKIGDFKSQCILARVSTDKYALIYLKDGNLWHNGQTIKCPSAITESEMFWLSNGVKFERYSKAGEKCN